MQYVLLIYTPEPTEEVPPEVLAAQMAEYNAVTEHLRDRGRDDRRRGARLGRDGDDRPGRGRQDDHDRRAVRRDEGDARRLLPGRGGRPRRGDRLRGDDPGRPDGCIEVRPVWDYADGRGPPAQPVAASAGD